MEFDLRDTIRSTYDAFAAINVERGVALTLEDDGAEGVFRGDPTRVRQILFNLLSNAAKFTERGQITVRLFRLEAGVRLVVRDTGIGMEAETAQQMFEKFSQADLSTTRRFGGTGLGLSICRELAVGMGGSISVETALGLGSAFTVDLPLPFVRLPDETTHSMAPDPIEVMAERNEPLRILVAEDNETNQLVMRSLLAIIEDIEVEIVENGALAVEAWESRTWDLILMDVNMPVMDGVTATRQIRALERSTHRSHTPIISLTAN
ncbi:MAG: ATP-binding protein, partial [Rhodoglobus sp.]|nr:ATP-binding protein [Rhodoglobus sp.]